MVHEISNIGQEVSSDVQPLREPINILIAEWVPSLNKGELAILIGMLRTFGQLGRVRVSAFSLYPEIDRKRYPAGIRVIDLPSGLGLPRSLLHRSGLATYWASFRALLLHLFFAFLCKTLGSQAALGIMRNEPWGDYCEADIIIICHDQVSCVAGCVLLFSPIYVTIVAKVLGKPIVIYANGSSGFSGKVWEALAGLVLREVDLITVRDKESFLLLGRITRGEIPIYLTGDPAVLLRPASVVEVSQLLKEGRITKHKPIVGVCLTREVLEKAFGKESTNPLFADNYTRAINEISRALDSLANHLSATIVFVPHSIESYGLRDDRLVAKEIYAHMRTKSRAHLFMRELSPEELKGLIGQFDIFVSSRVHAAIGALSCGVPTLVLSYSPDTRASSLVGGMFGQRRWVYDVERLDAKELVDKLTELLSDSHAIRRGLAHTTELIERGAMLNGTLLRALLMSRGWSLRRTTLDR